MTVEEALREANSILKSKNVQTPVREAGVLLAFVLKKDISWLYAHPEHILLDEHRKKFIEIVGKRCRGIPFQYISNHQEFMSLDFYVNNNCLIPRADTETLVEAAVDIISNKPGYFDRVLDIGTGSGAIAISIAHYAKNAIVDAIDISKEAINVAKANAKKHGVENRVKFIHSDFLQFKIEKPYSIVVSNPPYIPRSEIENLMPEVAKYEPRLALNGGKDGLIFYRAMALQISNLLTDDGVILVEVGIGQDVYVKELFEKKGLYVKTYRDLAGINRVVCGFRKYLS